MPKPVTVTFTGTQQNPVWSISPMTVTIKKHGDTIVFSPAAQSTWSFVSVNVTPNDSWRGATAPNSTDYVLDDPGTPTGQFSYTVTIQLPNGGGQVTFPDSSITADPPPIIQNDGSSDPEPQY